MNNMKFKPEDFEYVGIQFSISGFYTKKEIDFHQKLVTEIANKKLQEWLKGSESVTGYIDYDNGGWLKFSDLYEPTTDTHKALLINIEEIKGEE